MTLAAGQSLTFYEILGPLGAGGMGEVYRARDTRLEREVAIKVLPEELADDEERLRRFEREAKTLASLNHPNIAGIHGVDQDGDVRFLALELVSGEDLAARLLRGPLPVDEAIEVCRQIAEGLEAAHENGVVHRDLKPANVRVAQDGVVKVLDFGLAKPIHPTTRSATGPGATTAEPDSFLMTKEGLVLGTPTYMSPEQARGKLVDRRTDIWAFGCVLYECLTGKRAFSGESITDTLAAIVGQDPDWSALPAATPARLRALLARCLVKDPRQRLRDIGEARLALSGAFGGLPPVAVPADTRGARWLPWTIAVALAVALALAMLWRAGPEPGGAPAETTAQHRLPEFTTKTFGRQTISNARFLPDGRSIVYSSAPVGNRPKLYLLRPDSMAPREIGPVGTKLLSVSSTGELAVLTDTTFLVERIHEGMLARRTIDGGPRALVEDVRDADWGPDGELAIIRNVGGLDRLEYPIGNVLVETAGYMSEPRVSKDGATVAYLDHSAMWLTSGWVKTVDRMGDVRTLSGEYSGVQGLAWTPDGRRLLYTAFQGAGEPRTLSVGAGGGDARSELTTPGGHVVLDAAPDGRLLVLQEDNYSGVAVRVPGRTSDVDLSWLDRSTDAIISPDGEKAVFGNYRAGKNGSVSLRRLDGSPMQTLGDGHPLAVSPDGKWLLTALLASPRSLLVYPMGAGAERRLERGPIETLFRSFWFPDSKHVLVVGSEPGQPVRGYRQSIDGGPPERVTPERLRGAIKGFSPQGDRLIARDDDRGWLLVPIPGPGAVPDDDADLVPAAGFRLGDEMVGWSPDGRAVYVSRIGDVPAHLERVDLATGERTPSITVGPSDEVGLVEVWFSNQVFDPKGTFAYSYQRLLSNLYVVDGVQ